MMRRYILPAILCLIPFIGWAQEETIDEKINKVIEPVTNLIESIIFYTIYGEGNYALPFVLVWLLVGAIFFTVRMKFINLKGMKIAFDIVRGKYTNPNEKGEVSHFQALTAALSGTVGLGNIAGVAIAISVGGPGATFWMIVAGFLGMSSKFVECTLGVKFRKINSDGSVSGGPMYYLSHGITQRHPNLKNLAMILGGSFAVMCIGGSFGGGNMFQINQATKQLVNVTGGEASFFYGNGWIFGVIIAVLVGIVIIGGIKSIARVTDKIVPGMCGLYVATALIIIFAHFTEIPSAIGLIFEGAFSPDAAVGGFIGVLVTGFRRAAFSNEAGVGSAAIAHSAVKTNEPITEGLVALLEPFIDTIVVCTMTALVIVITGMYQSPESDGVTLTSMAFESVIPGSRFILALAVILFAFSTMISWSYYGLKSWTYLFGSSKNAEYTYKALFCVFVVIGSAMDLGAVIGFSDAMIFAMSFPNILGLYILSPVVKSELESFISRIKSGEIKAYK